MDARPGHGETRSAGPGAGDAEGAFFERLRLATAIEHDAERLPEDLVMRALPHRDLTAWAASGGVGRLSSTPHFAYPRPPLPIRPTDAAAPLTWIETDLSIYSYRNKVKN